MGQPTRRRIAALLLRRESASLAEIAAATAEAPGRVAYHLRVLARHDVVRGTQPRDPRAGVRFRFSPDARWAREMLGEEDEAGP